MAANPYDPVTTTDSTQLTEDDWGFQTPQIRYNRFSGTSRFKTLCGALRRHNKAVLIATTAMFVLVFIIIIIAVVANHDSGRHPTGDEGQWENPKQGLVFYPVPEDKTIVISFTPDKFHELAPQPIRKSLDKVMEDYSSVKQLNEAIFTDCNNSYSPGDKTCRVSRNLFGDDCASGHNYGYGGGQPCVFIQLNLPDGVTIKPIKKESSLWDNTPVEVQEQPDPSYIPVTCKGTAPLDTEILEGIKGYGPKEERIMSYPKQGLQSYIYRKRNTTLPFLKPGVMVQFTSLASRQMVHITCIAYGQLYDSQDRMIHHKPLSAQFALYANHA